jgi:hypothetical protein
MSKFWIDLKKAKKLRALTPDEEKEIVAWCKKNPDADLDRKIKVWRKRFNCSETSIMCVVVAVLMKLR